MGSEMCIRDRSARGEENMGQFSVKTYNPPGSLLSATQQVSYFRQLRQEGQSMTQTVRLGAERRLRPVLMTASITAFGLVPLLFATGPGSEIQRPLAIVVIGGLVTSTLLTLVLLPILFERFGEGRGEQDFEEVLANG